MDVYIVSVDACWRCLRVWLLGIGMDTLHFAFQFKNKGPVQLDGLTLAGMHTQCPRNSPGTKHHSSWYVFAAAGNSDQVPTG